MADQLRLKLVYLCLILDDRGCTMFGIECPLDRIARTFVKGVLGVRQGCVLCVLMMVCPRLRTFPERCSATKRRRRCYAFERLIERSWEPVNKGVVSREETQSQHGLDDHFINPSLFFLTLQRARQVHRARYRAGSSRWLNRD